MLKRKYVRQRCQLRKSTDLVQEPRTFSAYEYIAVLRTFNKSYRDIIKLIGTIAGKKVGHQISVSFEKFDVVQALLSFWL
jgi:hypothetical protein